MKIRGSRSSNGFIGLDATRATSLESGILTVNNAFDSTAAWIRPSNWLSMPDMTAGDQRIALLAAVHPSGRTGNALGATAAGTLIVVNSTDSYIVDWGNGVTVAARGGSRGLLVKYDDLPVSTTVTGQMATAPGSEIAAGYRQILVQIYLDTAAGATTFSSINVGIFSANLSASGLNPSPGYNINTLTRPKWLSIKGASSTLTSLRIGGGTGGTSACPFLQEFEWIGPTSLTNCSNLFNGSTNLVSVKGTEWCRNVQNFDSAFANCLSLKELPLLNTSNATSMRSMFSRCPSLETVTHFDTTNVINFAGMFNGCTSLKTIPAFRTANARNMDFMFNECFKLVQIPEINTSNVTSFNSTFANTSSLKYLPPLNTQSGVTFSNMFASSSIQKVYPINLISGRLINGMFSDSSIANAYLYNYDLSPATPKTASNAFLGCGNLNAIRLKYASNLTLSWLCPLTPVREIITDGANISASSGQNITYSVGYLRRMVLKNVSSNFYGNISNTVSATGQCLSPEALNELYQNLATVGTSGSDSKFVYNLLGHWGYDQSLTGIAKSKGWNVNTILPYP